MTSGLAIYDTMQYIRSPVSTVCIGQAASMGSLLLCAGAKGKRFSLAELAHHDPPAFGRRAGAGDRHRDPGARDTGACGLGSTKSTSSIPANRSKSSRPQSSATNSCRRSRRRSSASIDEVVEARPGARRRNAARA